MVGTDQEKEAPACKFSKLYPLLDAPCLCWPATSISGSEDISFFVTDEARGTSGETSF